MKVHHVWTIALFASLCATASPAGATTYTMSVQSVPAAGSKCVSLPNGPSEQGMRVLIWDCNGFLGQTLVYNDQTQELKFGTNCVGVIGNGNAQDAVGVGTCSGVVAQRWSMVPVNDNYQIIGVNNLCLDIANAVIANGTPLDLLPCTPDKVPELWVLYQAADPSAQTASNQTNPAGGAGAGQSGSAPDPNSSASSSNPGSGSGPSGGGSGPSGGGSGPSGGGSGPGGGSAGPGGGSLGPLGGASTPAGGPSLPGPIVILVGAINPPFDPGTNPFAPPMDPGTTTMDPGTTTTDPGNMTPASGSGPLTQQICGLGPDGQLVTLTMSVPPISPGMTPDTGQYCMRGGTLDGQCGTMTLDPVAQTMQLCMHGQCTSPLPVNATNTNNIPPSYNPTFLGVPESSPTVPCPGTTTASTDPMGGLGPPPMDVAYPKLAGKPQYSSLPKIVCRMPQGPQITTIAVNLGGLGGAGGLKPGNICQPKQAASPCQPKPMGSPCQPKLPANACATPVSPKPNGGPLKLKPSTQVASTGQPCNPKNQSAPVQACESKPPFLPWGGTGSASITVSGGKACGIGWHDTGATVLDSMSVSSPPSHGSLAPQDQHVIIFTPAPGYKGQDSFMLSMQEHNGGRRATLKVKVSVTIQ